MPIPHNHADKLLADCGRRCCICRRFKPLHLQVHHIQPREDGGSDEPDNLIALCVTCHSSVHTKASMARNFTAVELRQHRDNTVTAVREGRLTESTEPPDVFEATLKAMLSVILPSLAQPTAPSLQLMPAAVEILVTAAKQDQPLLPVQYEGGWALQCGPVQFAGGYTDRRKQATYRRAFEQLVQSGLVEHAHGNVWGISHDGYLLADQLIAAAQLRSAQPETTL